MTHTLHLSFHPAQAPHAQDLRAHLLAAGCTLTPHPAQADRVILLLSQLWMDEVWPSMADVYATPAQRDRLLPLLAQPCALPPWLARLRPADFTQPQDAPAIATQLLARLAQRSLRLVWQVDGDVEGEDRVLRGHADFVTGVTLREPAGQLVSASQDGSLIVWEAEGGRAIAALSGHSGSVLAVAADPTADAIFSAGRDGTLRRWLPDESGAWQTTQSWPIPTTVHTLAPTPDGRYLLLAAQDAGLMVLDLAADTLTTHDHLHQDWVRTVAILPEKSNNLWLAVSAGDDRALVVWDVATGTLRHRWPDGGGQAGGFISALAGLPAGQVLAGSDDRTVAVWDVLTGQVLHTFRGHAASVRSVAVSADGRRAISAGNDGGLILWNLAAGRAEEELDGHDGAVPQVVMAADGSWAVSASTDTTLRRWRLDGVRPERTGPQGHRAEITALAIYPRSSQVRDLAGLPQDFVDRPAGSRTRLEHSSGEEFASSDANVGHLRMPDSARHDGTLVSAAEDGRMILWDAATGAAQGEARPRFPILTLALVPGGERMLAVSEAGGVEVWRVPFGKEPIRTLSGRGAILCAAASPDGRTVAGGSVNWAVKLWDLDGKFPDRTLTGHRGGVTALAFLPDGRLLSGDEVGVLRVWDLPNTRSSQVRDLAGPPGEILGRPAGSRTRLERGEGAIAQPRPLLVEPAANPAATTRSSQVRDLAGAPGEILGRPAGSRTRLERDEGAIDQPRPLLVEPAANPAATTRSSQVRDLAGAPGEIVERPAGSRTRLERGEGWRVSDDPITAIVPVPDQNWAVIGGEGLTPRLVDLESGAVLAEYVGHTDWILGLGIGDQGRVLITGADDASLRLWDVVSGAELGREDLPRPLAALVVDPMDSLIYCGDIDGRVRCFIIKKQATD